MRPWILPLAAVLLSACANRKDNDDDGYRAKDDCDDSAATANPGGTEVCDGIDNDCDGSIDEDLGSAWYADADGDGYGDAAATQSSCSQPPGYVADATDCDDSDEAYNPGAAEDDCTDPNDYNCDGSAGFEDGDGDGMAACEDCDDGDATRFEGADEVCDGVDNDCNDEVDDDPVDGTAYYLDYDNDGYGVDNTTYNITACEFPEGYAEYFGDCDDTSTLYNPGVKESDCTDPNDYNCDESTGYDDVDADGFPACEDCNDADAASNPDGTEYCDDLDNDCDGDIDEEAVDSVTWYYDNDADGYGRDDATTNTADCDAPTDYVGTGDDCDDADASIYPGATEICDDVDQDCDSEIDEEATDPATWYADSDADNYGDAATTTDACDQPDGYVDDSTDCDDTNDAVYPDAGERCDKVDNDCDGEIDEELATVWYADADGDGYGDAATSVEECDPGDGYVADATDCDDTNALSNPAATEICDDLDNNCDASVDEDLVATWYTDADADGYGDPSTALDTCAPGATDVSDATDCDDTDALSNPGATEICDDTDNDCNGTVDDDLIGTWYSDSDGDGYGDPSTAVDTCAPATSDVMDATDCDDTDATSNPGATEICDDTDNDCNGTVDDDLIATWHTDSDGYGDPSTATDTCAPAATDVADATDCDDADATSNPGATEVCDGSDNDCDGSTDEGVTTSYYADADSDGYGDSATSVAECSAPAGYVTDSTDCDDTAASAYPGATEICDDLDNDCDGATDDDDSSLSLSTATYWYADTDSDGYGRAATPALTCDAPTGYVADSSDCNDTSSAINPAADEVCDGVDNDCDGSADVSASDETTYYLDADADGYGLSTSTMSSCSLPTGYATNATDCDDGSASVNPAADEVCDGADNDCDGKLDDADSDIDISTGSFWYGDADGDTYGLSTSVKFACEEPSGYVDNVLDCNDGDAAINPGADEVCDSADNDCDGTADESSAIDAGTWYRDADSDDYGDSATSSVSCSQPTGYVADATDCDDASSITNPGAEEVCNDGVDNDCDGGFIGCTLDLADADVIFEGGSASDEAGIGMSAMGDMDGDGYDELAIGARSADDSATDAGTTYFYWGSTLAGLVGDVNLDDADLLITGASASNKSGKSIAGNGDFNGDGTLDMVVNAANFSVTGSARGAFYIIYGGTLAAASGTFGLGSADVRYDGETTFDYAGGIVSNAGHVNSATYDAILAGAVGDDDGGANAGAIYVMSGTATSGTVATLSSSYYAGKILGEAASQAIGGAQDGAGDLDGDGFDDVIVGSTKDTTGGSNAGASYLIGGPIVGSLGLASADAKLLGSAGDQAGSGVTGAGDVNGDGYDDVLVSAPYNDGVGTDTGVVWLVNGVATLSSLDGADLTSSYYARMRGATTSALLGSSLAGGGDNDGDGTPDLLISATTTSSSTGSIYLFSGPLSGTYSTTDAFATFDGESVGDGAGSPMRFVGDITNTGIDSLLIAAQGSDRGGTDAGSAYLIHDIGN